VNEDSDYFLVSGCGNVIIDLRSLVFYFHTPYAHV